jgi:hypothetical protein
MTEKAWIVIARGRMTDEARGAISGSRITLFGSTGGGFASPGGDLPETTNHTLIVHAESGDAAVEQVRQAVGEHLFVEDEARESG